MSGEHVRRTFIVENTWVCSSCKAKNLGRHVKCQQCGSTKEKDESDIVPDPEREAVPEVTDPELLRQARQGPNWFCEFCSSQVRDEFGNCKNCSAPKKNEPEKEVERDTWSPPRRAHYNSPPPPDPPPSYGLTGGQFFRWFFTVAGVLLFIWFLVWLITPKKVDATVQSINWQYNVTLERDFLKHGSGWGTGARAFNISCQSKYYGTENCQPYDCNPRQVEYSCGSYVCGTKTESYSCQPYSCNCRTRCRDNKNGYSTCSETCSTCYRSCTRQVDKTCTKYCNKTEYSTCYKQCPVYRDWCEYDYYEWAPVDSAATSGATHVVSWPALQASGSRERLRKSEKYQVLFGDGKETWELNPDSLGEFKRFSKDSRWRIEIGPFRNVKVIQPL